MSKLYHHDKFDKQKCYYSSEETVSQKFSCVDTIEYALTSYTAPPAIQRFFPLLKGWYIY